MSIEKIAGIRDYPAQTYMMNTLESIITRFGIPKLTDSEISDLNTGLDVATLAIQSTETPPVPVINPQACDLAVKFDDKMLLQLVSGVPGEYIHPLLREKTTSLIEKHRQDTESISSNSTQMIVDASEISQHYGINDIFGDPSRIALKVKEDWGHQAKHPNIPKELQKPVDLATTKQLIAATTKHLFGETAQLTVDVRMVQNHDDYSLFWAFRNDRLDFATPELFDRATQLSFDIPHNVAHLLHMSKIPNEGVLTYIDTMAERSYFESVAMLSEHTAANAVDTHPAFIQELGRIFAMDPAEIGEWVHMDRAYEFRLRCARFLGESVISAGGTYEEAIQHSSGELNIDLDDAYKEVNKYLPWIGLGALYMKGYLKHLSRGSTNVAEAISTHGNVIRTWSQIDALIVE